MAMPTDINYLGNGSPQGSIIRGQSRPVIQGNGATRTLLQRESGALVLFDRAAGIVYTLPVPIEGTYFDFAVTVSITSNAAKVVTANIASNFIVGAVVAATIATAAPAGFSANGTTIAALSANGSTTGGLQGETYRLTAMSATQWVISGVTVGSGVLVTPFAIS